MGKVHVAEGVLYQYRKIQAVGETRLTCKDPFKKKDKDALPRGNRWRTSQFCGQYHFSQIQAHIYPMVMGRGILPKIFMDPKYSAAQTDTDNDSETNPLHIPLLGDYCQTCISKWTFRLGCRPNWPYPAWQHL